MRRRLSDDGLAGIELAFVELLVDGLAVGELKREQARGQRAYEGMSLLSASSPSPSSLSTSSCGFGLLPRELAAGELTWVRVHCCCCSQW